MFSDEEISVFLDELEEKIQVLNENILVLEREGENQEALQEIFRAAHTIKGSSAVMGYDKMATLTHEIENLFDQMRKGLLPVSGPLVDTLFLALDTLHVLRDEIIGKDVSVDIEQVVARLRQCQGPQSAPAAGEAPEAGQGQYSPPDGGVTGVLEDVDEEVIREAGFRGNQAYWVNVEVDPACQMKSVRAFLVFETIQQVGEVIKCEPSAEDIQEGRFDVGFRVVLLTSEDADRIRNLIMTVSEVTRADISRIKLAEGPGGALRRAEPGSREKNAEQTAKAEHAEVKTVQTVRVDVQNLDTLMNLVGELVIDRTRLNRFAEIFEGRFGTGSSDLVEKMNEISGHLGQVTGDLQEQIMKARMLPVAQVFNRFPRMVRDLAQKLGKEVNFIVEGHETELDRNVIEVIGDPLIHLIRNALDHGIEEPEERVRLGKARSGVLRLKASYMENHIIITVQDDGKGMDPARLRAKAVEKGLVEREAAERMSDAEAVNLIFLPGFSTVTVVSDLSGRGVGMDIVRNHIEQINGIVEVFSTLGAGTTFTIKLPLTLAIIRAMMVELANEQFAFPLTNVLETISVKAGEIKKVKHNEVILVRGRILPLVRLADIFEREDSGEEKERLFVVVLGIGDKRVGVIVDKLLGDLEIVIKSLGDYLGKVPCLSGATILGDGQVALIVDVRSLVKEIGVEEAVYAAG
ncbi:MAG: Chemotaxis protein CheA [Pelotomaculum sp. PtaU1.Bin035]|nr:MAG: Chemotaxis protein CheA [Pelotomaculum sp. PtaU1.Bin035]